MIDDYYLRISVALKKYKFQEMGFVENKIGSCTSREYHVFRSMTSCHSFCYYLYLLPFKYI